MRTLPAVLALMLAALLTLGAQSCSITAPPTLPPVSNTVSWQGWLDEGTFIKFDRYVSQLVLVTVYPTTYKALNLRVFAIPTEDYQRFLDGKPYRVLLSDETLENGILQIYCYPCNIGYVSIIVQNRWVPDFISGDVYIEVSGDAY